MRTAYKIRCVDLPRRIGERNQTWQPPVCRRSWRWTARLPGLSPSLLSRCPLPCGAVLPGPRAWLGARPAAVSWARLSLCCVVLCCRKPRVFVVLAWALVSDSSLGASALSLCCAVELSQTQSQPSLSLLFCFLV